MRWNTEGFRPGSMRVIRERERERVVGDSLWRSQRVQIQLRCSEGAS